MKKIVMYCTTVCPYCERAELLLRQKGVQEIEKIVLDHDEAGREDMVVKTGRRTVPQIFIGDTHIGGFDDLSKLNANGALEKMLLP